jgi:hypothetical protein
VFVFAPFPHQHYRMNGKEDHAENNRQKGKDQVTHEAILGENNGDVCHVFHDKREISCRIFMTKAEKPVFLAISQCFAGMNQG